MKFEAFADLGRLFRENHFEIYALSPGSHLALRHSSGAKIYIAGGDAQESAFSYCFATPSENDRGLAHIVEHVVFCGSKNYPLKEPFANLQKHSLASFLNAMTYPDQTLYPAASAFAPDFLQLLRVYGDAVFFPLLEREAIAQEGIRQSPVHTNKNIELDGIVYNEMQGYYGDFDTYAADCSLRSLFCAPVARIGLEAHIGPAAHTGFAHPNSFDSGGSPEAIAAIDCRDYREVREFHSRYYQPTNCRIVMYGPIVWAELEQILAYLGRELLPQAQTKNTKAPPVKLPINLPELPKAQQLYEAVPSQNPGRRSVMCSWVLPPQRNVRRSLEYQVMNELLLGHSGAILEQPITESAWGADLALGSGLELDLATPVLRAGLSGYKPKDGECFRKLIWDALERFCEQAENPQNTEQKAELELLWHGALNSLEYEERSILEHGGSEGICALEYCLQMARSSLYYDKNGNDADEVFAALHPPIEELRNAGLAAFVPKLRRYTLENEHWTLQLFEEVAAEPQKIVPTLPLGADELQSAQQNFARYQERCDKPEDSRRIRAMKRSEFDKLAPLPACLRRFYPASRMTIEFFCIAPTENQKSCQKRTESPQFLENAHTKIAQVPQTAQTGQRAGLVQVNLYWEISRWKREDALLLPLFLDLIAELGLTGQPYEKTARQKSLQIGSWDAEIVWKPQFRKRCGSQTVRSFAHIQLSFLPREWQGGLALFWELLGAGEWQNEAKLLELLQSRYYEKSAELHSSPLSYAVQRSCYRLFASQSKEPATKLEHSSQAELAEWFYGLGQIELLSKLCAQPKKYLAPLVSSLLALRRRLLCDAPPSCALAAPDGILNELANTLAAETAFYWAKNQRAGQTASQTQTESQTIGQTPAFWAGLCKHKTGTAHELWRGDIALEHLCIALPIPEWPQSQRLEQQQLKQAQDKSREGGPHLRPALEVLARLLQSGPAWEKIRLQQGAYGVRAGLRGGYFLLCSNEDPNAQNSIDLFRAAIEEIRDKASLAQQEVQKVCGPESSSEQQTEFCAEFEGAVVQILAERLKEPPAHQYAQIALHREKTGLYHSDLSAWLEELRELQLNDIYLAASYLLANWQHKALCIFTGRTKNTASAGAASTAGQALAAGLEWERYTLPEYAKNLSQSA